MSDYDADAITDFCGILAENPAFIAEIYGEGHFSDEYLPSLVKAFLARDAERFLDLSRQHLQQVARDWLEMHLHRESCKPGTDYDTRELFAEYVKRDSFTKPNWHY